MPIDVVLVFDFGGVITAAAVPAARRLAEFHMQLVFERAARNGAAFATDGVASIAHSPHTMANRYSNIYFMIPQFIQRVSGKTPAWTRLETGNIRRMEYIQLFHEELQLFLKALAAKPEELSALNLRRPTEVADWKKRNVHLCIPAVQQQMLDLLDAESFLCVLEKLSLRKNVLNMLHYLRVKSFQEIKLGIITNNWEAEGHYVRTSSSINANGQPTFVTASCPIEYDKKAGAHGAGAFDVNGLFDAIAQSYLIGKCKPNPDIFEIGVESVVGRNHHGPSAAKPLVFFFDDIKQNCDAARNAPSKPFTNVYHISNGPTDVFKYVREAIAIAAAKDVFWKKILDGLDQDIAPLFATVSEPNARDVKLSWVQAEFQNADGNLLFMPPPPNATLEPMSEVRGSNKMDLEERNRILHFLGRTCPQYFPLTIKDKFEDCGNLSEDGSFATSSGPITFEMFRGGMSNPTYRITLRTGSFVLRKQPRGKILPGAHDMKREFDVFTFLAKNSNVPVPKCITHCSDRTVCSEDFYLMRYRDGRMIYKLPELSAPPFSRPFSQSRVLAKTTLNPRLFFKEAILTLCKLHDAPIPPFLQTKSSGGKAQQLKLHPLMHSVQVWEKQYRRSLDRLAPDDVSKVKSSSFEYLTDALQMTFTHNSDGSIPFPEKMCLTHGDFKIDNVMFTHRCLEGRAKYPPRVVMLLDFELCSVGDPLTDVAYLALFHFFPPPRGILGLNDTHKTLFPSPQDLLEFYCHKANYMSGLTVERRKKIFEVYMAAMCHKLAGIAHGVVARGFMGNATDPEGALRLLKGVDHLSRMGCQLLGLKEPPKSHL